MPAGVLPLRSLLCALLLAGCSSGPLARSGANSGANGPGVYTPIGSVARPIGGLSTNCRLDINGLDASCRALDQQPQGPISPISAGQSR